MKLRKRIITMVLVALLTCSLFATVAEAATATKTIYVVSGISIKEGTSNTKADLTYNDKGFITRSDYVFKDEKIRYTMTYNQNNQLTRIVENILTGSHKGKNAFLFTMKNGLVVKRTDKSSDGEQGIITYQYNSKNQLISYKEGDRKSKVTTNKEGRVVKRDSGDIVQTATYTDKGYLKNQSAKFNGTQVGYVKNTYTYYKNGIVKTMTTTFKNPMMSAKKTQTFTYTYKKITVNKADADAIAAQQRELIQQTLGSEYFMY